VKVKLEKYLSFTDFQAKTYFLLSVESCQQNAKSHNISDAGCEKTTFSFYFFYFFE